MHYQHDRFHMKMTTITNIFTYFNGQNHRLLWNGHFGRMALVHILDQFGSLVEIHFKIKIGLVLNWHKMGQG